MAKVQQILEIAPSFAFTEFDFYKDYEESFKKSELGRIHALLPLHEMAFRFDLIDAHAHKKAGRKSYFSPEGKVALMFLKSYAGLSAPKLMEQLNANIHYQIFCGIRISTKNPLANYRLIDDIVLELSNRLKIQNQQEAIAEAWKPYMKQCRHTQKRTRKMIRRLLDLLGKILAELRKLDRENPCVGLFSDNQLAEIEIITKIYRQQRKHHESGNAKESIPDRIVSVNKPYVRPIVRGKENCESGTQPGCLTTYPSDINTSYKG